MTNIRLVVLNFLFNHQYNNRITLKNDNYINNLKINTNFGRINLKVEFLILSKSLELINY